MLAVLLISGCYTKKGAIRKFCKADTITSQIVVRDTIVTERVQVDTIFNSTTDTITLIKDNLIIRYRKVAGKIMLSGEVKADTIYREKLVTVTQPVYVESLPHWKRVLMLFGLFFLVVSGLIVISKFLR